MTCHGMITSRNLAIWAKLSTFVALINKIFLKYNFLAENDRSNNFHNVNPASASPPPQLF